MATLVYQRVYKSDWQLPLRILIYWYILHNSEIYKWQQQMTFDRPRFQGSIFRWIILAVKTLWYLWILVSSNILPLFTFISTGWLCWSKTLGAYRLPLPGQSALPCSPSTLLQENKTLYTKHKHNQTEHQWIYTCITLSTSINKYS